MLCHCHVVTSFGRLEWAGRDAVHLVHHRPRPRGDGLRDRGGPPPDDGGIIRISSNENARGPGPKVIAALHNTISPRAGRGYPPDHTNELVDTIAELYGVERDSVIIGTGSGSILEAGVRAFCSAEKPLVTVAPTYGTPASMARRIGAGIKMVPVDRSLALDLDAMAEAANGAGMVFFCNPNNPTGTVHTKFRGCREGEAWRRGSAGAMSTREDGR